MSFLNYLKEKWITYVFIFSAFVFAAVVYLVDKSLTISYSNANYIMLGWVALLIIFVVVDYLIFNSRLKKMKKYCQLHASIPEKDEFSYPLDLEYAELVDNLVYEFEGFKAEIHTKSTEDLEFITRWLHDVKVPISAARLIVENHEADLPKLFYQHIDTELFSIEQSVQRVFYELKSNSFFDDYKITKVSTKKLIANTLKGYANFFSYKKIKIAFVGDEHIVLTDEKWSGYILSQIISNAVKYTSIEGRITISTSKNGQETVISIKNSGQGILAKDIRQVFNKGYTSSENRNRTKATGYGLYLSKKLSDILGHQLTVQSERGEYTSFDLIFTENKTIHHVTQM